MTSHCSAGVRVESVWYKRVSSVYSFNYLTRRTTVADQTLRQDFMRACVCVCVNEDFIVVNIPCHFIIYVVYNVEIFNGRNWLNSQNCYFGYFEVHS